MSKRTTGAATVAPAPRKSGANIPESQRSTVQLKLRVEPDVVTMLDEMCRHGDADGWTRSNFVAGLIDSEYERRKRRKQ